MLKSFIYTRTPNIYKIPDTNPLTYQQNIIHTFTYNASTPTLLYNYAPIDTSIAIISKHTQNSVTSEWIPIP